MRSIFELINIKNKRHIPRIYNLLLVFGVQYFNTLKVEFM